MFIKLQLRKCSENGAAGEIFNTSASPGSPSHRAPGCSPVSPKANPGLGVETGPWGLNSKTSKNFS
jgi:hypothetical protein